jgi:hypothetical protein
MEPKGSQEAATGTYHISPVHILTPLLFNIHSNITLPSTSRSI